MCVYRCGRQDDMGLSGRTTWDGLAPICRDHLRGCCHRWSTCKFRHVTLDQYTTEVQDNALHGHGAAGQGCCGKKRQRHDEDGEEEEEEGRCCCKSQDRLRILQAENASLRKRVTDLRRKVALLSRQSKQRVDSDSSHVT